VGLIFNTGYPLRNGLCIRILRGMGVGSFIGSSTGRPIKGAFSLGAALLQKKEEKKSLVPSPEYDLKGGGDYSSSSK